MPAGEHINEDGEFQSDKYPWCQPGFVPLKLSDPMARSLLWAYAQRRRKVDEAFSLDLERCLGTAEDDDTLTERMAAAFTRLGANNPASDEVVQMIAEQAIAYFVDPDEYTEVGFVSKGVGRWL